MPENADSERKLAMLIDGDNVQLELVKQMREEASRYGSVVIRRAFGDWEEDNLAPWKQRMLESEIEPIQQSRSPSGKSTTDSGLIINAMDILHSGMVQGFCIVSSDVDFAELCARIRKAGLFVIGMGQIQTPKKFIHECDVFIPIENLITGNRGSITNASNGAAAKPAPSKPAAEKPTTQKATTQKATTKKPGPQNGSKKLKVLIQRAFDIAPSEGDWVNLGGFGSTLKSLDPNFSSRSYGYKSLSLLVTSRTDLFEVRGKKKSGPSSIYIRLKKG